MPSNAQSGACESSPAERTHGPLRGVEQYSASRGDLTELEASRSIAPSSVAGRADGEALAASISSEAGALCAHGFLAFRSASAVGGLRNARARARLGYLLRDAV